MLTRVTPAGIAPPLANYSHATLVAAQAQWLFVSGQVGTRTDGSVPAEVEEQTVQVFENIAAILAAGGMAWPDVVRINTFLTDTADLANYMKVRDRYVAAPPPASTLVVVQALARPEFRVEVEVIAAGGDVKSD